MEAVYEALQKRIFPPIEHHALYTDVGDYEESRFTIGEVKRGEGSRMKKEL
jgi:hypothetical protein